MTRKQASDDLEQGAAIFEREARAAFERLLREDDPGISDEQVAERLAGFTPSVVWARAVDRRTRGRGSVHHDYGSAPTTPEGLREAGRELFGGPGGRPSAQAARIAAMVEAAASLPKGADLRDTVAAVLGRVRMDAGTPTREPTSQYKRDVTQAGGWKAVQRQADILRRQRRI